MAIEEGKPAPAFTLADANGQQVSLTDFLGKSVVVFFYPKDDTPGCTKEACGFRDQWQELKDLGVVVLGVSPDGGESHHKFALKFKLPYTLLSDPSHAMMIAYGAWGEKISYGKTSKGVIRSTVFVGPDGKVRKHWPVVRDAEAHPAKVLEALKAR